MLLKRLWKNLVGKNKLSDFAESNHLTRCLLKKEWFNGFSFKMIL